MMLLKYGIACLPRANVSIDPNSDLQTITIIKHFTRVNAFPFKHHCVTRLIGHENIPCSQVSPSYPFTHVQLKAFASGLQVAPFRQGWWPHLVKSTKIKCVTYYYELQHTYCFMMRKHNNEEVLPICSHVEQQNAPIH